MCFSLYLPRGTVRCYKWQWDSLAHVSLSHMRHAERRVFSHTLFTASTVQSGPTPHCPLERIAADGSRPPDPRSRPPDRPYAGHARRLSLQLYQVSSPARQSLLVAPPPFGNESRWWWRLRRLRHQLACRLLAHSVHEVQAETAEEEAGAQQHA